MTEPTDERGPMPSHDLLPTPEDRLAARFEDHRAHLRAAAHRMLGSRAEADDAVQETWLRLGRVGTAEIDNLAGWLTRVVGRVCLDMLRARRSRHEREQATAVAGDRSPRDPEGEAVLADEVGLALLVVLDRLAPAERVAFVLHDLFAVPFAEIAPIVERSAATTKRLASRARHRVRGGDATVLHRDALAEHRRLVDAFLAATRAGDVAGLLELLAPDVVRRADLTALAPGGTAVLRGAAAVARETRTYAARARFARAALVGGGVGAVVAPAGRLVLALRLTIATRPGGPRITAIDVVADPARLATLDLALLPE